MLFSLLSAGGTLTGRYLLWLKISKHLATYCALKMTDYTYTKCSRARCSTVENRLDRTDGGNFSAV